MSGKKRESWAEALQADFESASRHVTVAMLAAHLGKSSSHVYQMIRGELPFSMAFLATWYDLTGARHLMRWAGRVTNHFVAPVPHIEAAPSVELPVMLREFADMVTRVGEAMADGRISPEEAQAVTRQGEHLIAAVYGVMLATERRATTIPLRPATIADAERKSGGAA